MAPKVRLTQVQKAKIAQQEGFELARKAGNFIVCAILKDNPKQLHDANQRLIDVGILQVGGEVDTSYTPPTDGLAAAVEPTDNDASSKGGDEINLNAIEVNRHWNSWDRVHPRISA